MRVKISDIWVNEEVNDEKLFPRGIDAATVLDVLVDRPQFFRNKRNRPGKYKMIGEDAGGRLLTVIISEPDACGLARTITAWASTAAEQKLWRRLVRD